MADLTLRGQCKRALDLISADGAAEAVAVCRRILEAFPKHIGVCSLLARAYLLLGERAKAVNLLQRVLSADPEHVESHVSLAAICEEQGLPEEALGHLQRALELSPGNEEIRREFQRLYRGRGLSAIERIKLTRAALARTYMRGQLYSKATGELRELLATKEHRFDLRVALAETLWLGRLYEDAETVCQALLAELPNCLKANLILGQIWLNTERDDQARALLQRAQSLDPENVTAQAVLGDRSPLPPRVGRLPLRDQDVPAIDLPYADDEEGPESDYRPVVGERGDTPARGQAHGVGTADAEPGREGMRGPQAASRSGETSSFAEQGLADTGAMAGTRTTIAGEVRGAPPSIPTREMPQDTLREAGGADGLAAEKERERQAERHRRVEELARAIDWEGMSLIDVRRQYVKDHPKDYQAQLDLARRLRDALKLNDALKYYAGLVEEDYGTLREVIHDLDLLSRIYPRTPAVQQLLAAAREKGHREPPQWQ